MMDSVYVPVSGYRILEDSNHRKVSISVRWKANTI